MFMSNRMVFGRTNTVNRMVFNCTTANRNVYDHTAATVYSHTNYRNYCI
jgi:hypothetical protein